MARLVKRCTDTSVLRSLLASVAICALMGGILPAEALRAGIEDRVGDFNGDGFTDVAAGAPRAGEGGAVRVLYGSRDGLSSVGELLSQHDLGMDVSIRAGDLFGAAVSAGDFDADGFSDLAVGAPGADVSGSIDAGAVYVFYGSSDGLSNERSERWTLDQVSAAGTEQPVNLGYELQTGDVGFGAESDLIAATTQQVRDVIAAGSIVVLFGTPSGLGLDGAQVLSQGSPGVRERPEPHDQFGVSLATGDFNGDGYDDVAAGSYESVRRVRVAGAINVLYGGDSGLSVDTDVLITQRTKGVGSRPRPYDQFGIVLAAGDFNADGWIDLAAGAPAESVQGQEVAGAVYVLFGSAEGVSGRQSQRLTQAIPGIPDHPEAEDLFGQSLASGDFGRGPGDDLAVSSFEDIYSHASAGAVHVIYGSDGGLRSAGSGMITQADPDVAGRPDERNLFGWALATGDVDASGFADLIVGAPGDDFHGAEDVGTIHVLKGEDDGLSMTGSYRTDGREGTVDRWSGGIGREVASKTS